MWALVTKEVNTFLHSLIGYVVIGVFLTGVGLLMWLFPDTSVLNYGYADMSTLFSLGPFVLMFLIPAITMRSFAEEKKQGTLELLYTRPLSEVQILVGKYLSSLVLVLIALLPTLVYYYSLVQLGNPVGNIDSAGVLGSYIGLFLLGALFTALGILSSTLTENQIVAFILAVFFCFIFYSGFDALASLTFWGAGGVFWAKVGILSHYESLSRGLLDTRDLVYFLTMIVAVLAITRFNLSRRTW